SIGGSIGATLNTNLQANISGPPANPSDLHVDLTTDSYALIGLWYLLYAQGNLKIFGYDILNPSASWGPYPLPSSPYVLFGTARPGVTLSPPADLVPPGGSPQFLAGPSRPAGPDVPGLTDALLQPVVAQAVSDLAAAGYDVGALSPVTFLIAPLPDDLLGLT